MIFKRTWNLEMELEKEGLSRMPRNAQRRTCGEDLISAVKFRWKHIREKLLS